MLHTHRQHFVILSIVLNSDACYINFKNKTTNKETKMKKLLLSLALLNFMGSALACDESKEQLLCSGDTVISKDGYVGKVIGLNVRSKNAMVKWHTTASGYSTNSRTKDKIKDLSIGKGCLAYLCVGDTVTEKGGYVGRVLGINPNSQSVAVRWHTRANGYPTNSRTTVRARLLSIGSGCIEGICVDDTVMDDDGYVGTVIGVNPNSLEIAVRWYTTGSGYSINSRSTVSAQNLYIEKYCERYDNATRLVHFSLRFQAEIGGRRFSYSRSGKK
jgi:preprotein translocase subunit YajC